MNLLQAFFALVTFCSVLLFTGTKRDLIVTYLPESALGFFYYGRAIQGMKQAGIVRLLQVPKSWFAHFYAYATVLQLSIVYTFLTISTEASPWKAAQGSWIQDVLKMLGAANDSSVSVTTSVYVALLYLLHLTRRLYENCYVSVFSGTKMNLAHYGVAFFHYTGCLFAILAHTCCFDVSGSSEGLEECKPFDSGRLNRWDWVAMALFAYGSWEQNRAHRQFANLRKGKDNKVVSMEHKMPSGGLFEMVSCPNYFAEIVIYVAIAIMFRGANWSWNWIMLWVIGNQVTSAVMNHKWYLKTFPNYPKSRKAIIPYLL